MADLGPSASQARNPTEKLTSKDLEDVDSSAGTHGSGTALGRIPLSTGVETLETKIPIFPVIRDFHVPHSPYLVYIGTLIALLQQLGFLLNPRFTCWGFSELSATVYAFHMPFYEYGFISDSAAGGTAVVDRHIVTVYVFLAFAFLTVLSLVVQLGNTDVEKASDARRYFNRVTMRSISTWLFVPAVSAAIAGMICNGNQELFLTSAATPGTVSVEPAGNPPTLSPSARYSATAAALPTTLVQCWDPKHIALFVGGIVFCLIAVPIAHITAACDFTGKHNLEHPKAKMHTLVDQCHTVHTTLAILLFHVLSAYDKLLVFAALYGCSSFVMMCLYGFMLPFYKHAMNRAFVATHALCAYASLLACFGLAYPSFGDSNAASVLLLSTGPLLFILAFIFAEMRVSPEFVQRLEACRLAIPTKETEDEGLASATYPDGLFSNVKFSPVALLDMMILEGDARDLTRGSEAGLDGVLVEPHFLGGGGEEHPQMGPGGEGGEDGEHGEGGYDMEKSMLEKRRSGINGVPCLFAAMLERVYAATDVALAARTLVEYQGTVRSAPTSRMVAFAARIFSRGLVTFPFSPTVYVDLAAMLLQFQPSLGSQGLRYLESAAMMPCSFALQFHIQDLCNKLRFSLGIRNQSHIQYSNKARHYHCDVLHHMNAFWMKLTEPSVDISHLVKIASQITKYRQATMEQFQRGLQNQTSGADIQLITRIGEFLEDALLDFEGAQQCFNEARELKEARQARSMRGTKQRTNVELDMATITQRLMALLQSRKDGSTSGGGGGGGGGAGGGSGSSSGTSALLLITLSVIFFVLVALIALMLYFAVTKRDTDDTMISKLVSGGEARALPQQIAAEVQMLSDLVIDEGRLAAIVNDTTAAALAVMQSEKAMIIASLVLHSGDFASYFGALTYGSEKTNLEKHQDYFKQPFIIAPSLATGEPRPVSLWTLGNEISEVLEEVIRLQYPTVAAQHLFLRGYNSIGIAFDHGMKYYPVEISGKANELFVIYVTCVVIALLTNAVVFSVFLISFHKTQQSKIFTFQLFTLIPFDCLEKMSGETRERIQTLTDERHAAAKKGHGGNGSSMNGSQQEQQATDTSQSGDQPQQVQLVGAEQVASEGGGHSASDDVLGGAGGSSSTGTDSRKQSMESARAQSASGSLAGDAAPGGAAEGLEGSGIGAGAFGADEKRSDSLSSTRSNGSARKASSSVRPGSSGMAGSGVRARQVIRSCIKSTSRYDVDGQPPSTGSMSLERTGSTMSTSSARPGSPIAAARKRKVTFNPRIVIVGAREEEDEDDRGEGEGDKLLSQKGRGGKRGAGGAGKTGAEFGTEDDILDEEEEAAKKREARRRMHEGKTFPFLIDNIPKILVIVLIVAASVLLFPEFNATGRLKGAKAELDATQDALMELENAVYLEHQLVHAFAFQGNLDVYTKYFDHTRALTISNLLKQIQLMELTVEEVARMVELQHHLDESHACSEAVLKLTAERFGYTEKQTPELFEFAHLIDFSRPQASSPSGFANVAHEEVHDVAAQALGTFAHGLGVGNASDIASVCAAARLSCPRNAIADVAATAVLSVEPCSFRFHHIRDEVRLIRHTMVDSRRNSLQTVLHSMNHLQGLIAVTSVLLILMVATPTFLHAYRVYKSSVMGIRSGNGGGFGAGAGAGDGGSAAATSNVKQGTDEHWFVHNFGNFSWTYVVAVAVVATTVALAVSLNTTWALIEHEVEDEGDFRLAVHTFMSAEHKARAALGTYAMHGASLEWLDAHTNFETTGPVEALEVALQDKDVRVKQTKIAELFERRVRVQQFFAISLALTSKAMNGTVPIEADMLEHYETTDWDFAREATHEDDKRMFDTTHTYSNATHDTTILTPQQQRLAAMDTMFSPRFLYHYRLLEEAAIEVFRDGNKYLEDDITKHVKQYDAYNIAAAVTMGALLAYAVALTAMLAQQFATIIGLTGSTTNTDESGVYESLMRRSSYGLFAVAVLFVTCLGVAIWANGLSSVEVDHLDHASKRSYLIAQSLVDAQQSFKGKNHHLLSKAKTYELQKLIEEIEALGDELYFDEDLEDGNLKAAKRSRTFDEQEFGPSAFGSFESVYDFAFEDSCGTKTENDDPSATGTAASTASGASNATSSTATTTTDAATAGAETAGMDEGLQRAAAFSGLPDYGPFATVSPIPMRFAILMWITYAESLITSSNKAAESTFSHLPENEERAAMLRNRAKVALHKMEDTAETIMEGLRNTATILAERGRGRTATANNVFIALLAVLIAVVCIEYIVVLLPVVWKLQDEELSARLLLRMIPVNVRDQVPAISEFIETGRIDNAAELQKKFEVSEKLLQNILPAAISARLKSGESPIADMHRSITILFTDFVGFTSISKDLNAKEIVEFLNEVFIEFDMIVELMELEKIKTIGDAYFMAGGLDPRIVDHGMRVIEAAMLFFEALRDYNIRHSHATSGNNTLLRMRLGIHTGPAVAGVIGTKKVAYDLWGESVEVANAMESTGVPQRIHVSETTVETCKDFYLFEPRPGPLTGKGVPAQMPKTFLVAGHLRPTPYQNIVRPNLHRMKVGAATAAAVKGDEGASGAGDGSPSNSGGGAAAAVTAGGPGAPATATATAAAAAPSGSPGTSPTGVTP